MNTKQMVVVNTVAELKNEIKSKSIWLCALNKLTGAVTLISNNDQFVLRDGIYPKARDVIQIALSWLHANGFETIYPNNFFFLHTDKALMNEVGGVQPIWFSHGNAGQVQESQLVSFLRSVTPAPDYFPRQQGTSMIPNSTPNPDVATHIDVIVMLDKKTQELTTIHKKPILRGDNIPNVGDIHIAKHHILDTGYDVQKNTFYLIRVNCDLSNIEPVPTQLEFSSTQDQQTKLKMKDRMVMLEARMADLDARIAQLEKRQLV